MSTEMVKYERLEDLEKIAGYIAKSRLFPQWETPEKVLTLMLLCQAEGRSPVAAVGRYDNIAGKIAKKSSAMLEDFLQAGGKVKWITLTDKACKAEFTAPGGEGQTFEYNWQEVIQAGNQSKDNYRKYPADMLKARLISRAMRLVWPQATNACYSPEELQDDTSETVRNITPPAAAPIGPMFAPPAGEVKQVEAATPVVKVAVASVDTAPGVASPKHYPLPVPAPAAAKPAPARVSQKMIDDAIAKTGVSPAAVKEYLVAVGQIRSVDKIGDADSETKKQMIEYPTAFGKTVSQFLCKAKDVAPAAGPGPEAAPAEPPAEDKGDQGRIALLKQVDAEQMTAFLVSINWLAADKAISDLTDKQWAVILKREADFIAKVKEFGAPKAVDNE